MKIQRELLEVIREHLLAKEISLLIGARQVGKTTLIKQIAEDLCNEGEKFGSITHRSQVSAPQKTNFIKKL